MKPYRDMQKIVGPIMQLHKDLEKSLEPLKEFQRSFSEINKLFAAIPKFENPFLEYVDTFKRIGEILKDHAENTPSYLLLLAQYAWFIEFDSPITLPQQVAYEIQQGRIEDADIILIEYYSSNIDRIFNELIDRHPNREVILNQILFAHNTKNHFILIPSLLTQADGICYDFTEKKLFIKEKNNNYLPQVTSVLEKSANSFLQLYLSPLQNQTPIIAREEDINKFPCSLNRHEILHGVKTDYGTEMNSLKVISLLKYMSDLLLKIDEKH